MKNIYLYGAGGHCFAVVELIRSLGEYQPLRIYDQNPKLKTILEVPVIKEDVEIGSAETMCITIGNNDARKKVAARYMEHDFPVFAHRSATVYPTARMGQGTQILPQAVIDADVTLGAFCIVNNNATVSHNVKAGDFVHIAINAAVTGGVSLGEGTLVGAGSVINPLLKIGKWVTIGAGAVVTKDVPDFAVVYGNPAQIIRYNKA